MKNNMQPNPNWALGTGKNCFVACFQRSSFEVHLRDLGFDVRLEMQKYTKAVEATDDSPNLVGLCLWRAGSGASRISSWNKFVWSHSFITIKFQLAWTNQMIHI
jgi:hypothetical protein